MLTPGQRHHGDHHDGHRMPHPSKADRWLVGLVAGAALMYLLGKALGLGRAPSPNHGDRLSGHDPQLP